ncbi:MAG: calcium-binding protein [Acidimicrobiales bacterium]
MTQATSGGERRETRCAAPSVAAALRKVVRSLRALRPASHRDVMGGGSARQPASRRARWGKSMKRSVIAVAAALVMFGAQAASVATAQEGVLCGPPGGEVPATITGSGLILGTSGDDVIVGSAADDVIVGGNGNDTICGQGGNDIVLGGQGDDVLIGEGGAVLEPPFAESTGENDDVLNGGVGNDVLAGLGGDDTLRGGLGDDQLIGFGGDDVIEAGPGDDVAFGGPLDDQMGGGPGNDVLWGNYGSDTIAGGPGDDVIDGDNPFEPPPELPFPVGTNDDACSGGPGLNTVTHCER